MNRRQFLGRSALGFLGGITVTLVGCDKESSSATDTQGGGTARNVNGVISGNHGHRAVVTAAQVTAGRNVTLSIRGSASHDHTVTLSATELASIRRGTRIIKTSGRGDNHTHTVTFN